MRTRSLVTGVLSAGLSVLSACAGAGAVRDGDLASAGQCLLDYKVVYADGDVPDWYTPPKDFCDTERSIAVPMSLGMYSLGYSEAKGAKAKVAPEGAGGKGLFLTPDKPWFYVIWGCNGPCYLAQYNRASKGVVRK